MRSGLVAHSNWVLAQQGYRSLQSTAAAVTLGVWVVSILELARAAAGLWLLRAGHDGLGSGGLLALAASWQARVALYLMLTGLLVLFFLRAAANARLLGARLDESPIRLVGVFLVPLVNLVLPYLAVKDIWVGGARPGERARVPGLVLVWWCVHVLHVHGEQVTGRLLGAEGVDRGLWVAAAMGAAALLSIPAAVLTGHTLRAFADRQDAEAGAAAGTPSRV